MELVPADETRITKTPKTVSPDTLIPQRWLEKHVHSFFLYPKTPLLFLDVLCFQAERNVSSNEKEQTI